MPFGNAVHHLPSWRRWAGALVPGMLLLCCMMLFLTRASAAPPSALWVYCPTNLRAAGSVEQLQSIMQTAAGNHYTHVLLDDPSIARVGYVDATYRANVTRVRSFAAANGLTIVPAICHLGYSQGPLLWNDPNLAEGFPVRDALYVVQNGEARLVADPPIRVLSQDFSDLTKWSARTANIVTERAATYTAARISNPGNQSTFIGQTVAVKPYRQYDLQVLVKTQDYDGFLAFSVDSPTGRPLHYNRPKIVPTRDWTLLHIPFNSLDQRSVTIVLAAHGNRGTVWMRSVAVNEIGLLNLVRRSGAPLVVKRESTGAVLREGIEYQPVSDPRMGTVPIPGLYELWHDQPGIRTSLPNGTRLRVSYYHAMIVNNFQVMICPSEQKTWELLRKEAALADELWGADQYFICIDEIRALNWDQSCTARGLTAGQIVADAMRKAAQTVQSVRPNARLYVWADMFDPYGNAIDKYYLVRGTLRDSWAGLSPAVTVVPWGAKAKPSTVSFFNGLGHPMLIAGYYDTGADAIAGNLRGWQSCTAGVPSINGLMYTTWQNNYQHLSLFANTAMSMGLYAPASVSAPVTDAATPRMMSAPMMPPEALLKMMSVLPEEMP